MSTKEYAVNDYGLIFDNDSINYMFKIIYPNEEICDNIYETAERLENIGLQYNPELSGELLYMTFDTKEEADNFIQYMLHEADTEAKRYDDAIPGSSVKVISTINKCKSEPVMYNPDDCIKLWGKLEEGK